MLMLIWFILAFISYGLMLARFQGQFPLNANSHYKFDIISCAFLSVWCPYASIVMFFVFLHMDKKFHGFKLF